MARQASSAFVIAGTHSGVGKTTVALGIMAALRRRGLEVQPFKIGPDFIDPGLHAKICGLPSYNLDGWMLARSYNRRCFQRHVQGKDVAVVEGMMGLYDGKSGASEEGSTAEMAKQLRLPVILVVDASAMARSAAALLLGYRLFDRKVNLIGVIFNRIGGEGHLRYLKEALRSLPNLQCFGGIPVEARLAIPERHLGLTTAEESFLDRQFVDRLATLVESHVDLDALLKRSRIKMNLPNVAAGRKGSGVKGSGVLPLKTPDPLISSDPLTPAANQESPIAVARDRAFCFYYPDNLELLRAAGAELKTFSPISDPSLPKGITGIYFGGGYPELYARELAENRSMRTAIKNSIEAGVPVYAECGGLMYLAEALIDQKNREYPMVGVYPFRSRMLPTLRMLGYREVVFEKKSFLPHRSTARGHEFHYSELIQTSTSDGIERAYRTRSANKRASGEGYLYKNCLASYVHLHFGSNPEFARKFVAACKHRRA